MIANILVLFCIVLFIASHVFVEYKNEGLGKYSWKKSTISSYLAGAQYSDVSRQGFYMLMCGLLLFFLAPGVNLMMAGLLGAAAISIPPLVETYVQYVKTNHERKWIVAHSICTFILLGSVLAFEFMASSGVAAWAFPTLGILWAITHIGKLAIEEKGLVAAILIGFFVILLA